MATPVLFHEEEGGGEVGAKDIPVYFSFSPSLLLLDPPCEITTVQGGSDNIGQGYFPQLRDDQPTLIAPKATLHKIVFPP